MAFTILLRFLKGSELKRGLERVFSAMSLKCCCPHRVDSSWAGDDPRAHGLLLTSLKDEVVVHGSPDMGSTNQQSKGITQWGTLELYLSGECILIPLATMSVAHSSPFPILSLCFFLVTHLTVDRKVGGKGLGA
ncbi:hypothetical protein Pyn_05070 [Prunus yedoensis var. nudiflora]|uniref:Uncharacterized protein n=1 Tax=Prunus yedoensis var. nudiflora TaxID=2094558 RepID=A0A314UT63_PRUYE|nr:hypothetical protein Pyn_05070 [Prunus yedoensis var. nudiflora]